MDRRTSLITAAAVGGALLLGAGAIAANIGVLNAADDGSIGNLSAEMQLSTPVSTAPAQVVDVYIEDPPVLESTAAPTTVAEPAAAATRQFAVEGAGSVTVERAPTGLFVIDVQANDSWQWSTEQVASNSLTVTFVSGDTTYEFRATVGADGQIEAHVDQPIINVVQAPATPRPASSATSNASATSSRDDDHDEGGDEDHHEDENEDEREHEGGDDDD